MDGFLVFTVVILLIAAYFYGYRVISFMFDEKGRVSYSFCFLGTVEMFWTRKMGGVNMGHFSEEVADYDFSQKCKGAKMQR